MGDEPYVVPLRVLAQMAQMPERIAEERQAEEDAARIIPGVPARITSGALAGYMVDITSIDKGLARCLMALGGLREVTVDVATLERMPD